jgi:hypothetical protein
LASRELAAHGSHRGGEALRHLDEHRGARSSVTGDVCTPPFGPPPDLVLIVRAGLDPNLQRSPRRRDAPRQARPQGRFRRFYEWEHDPLEQSRWRRDGGEAHSDLAHQGGGCGRAAHEFRGRGLPGTPGTLEGEMTHEACTAPTARSVFSPPAVRDGDRQTSLAYGPDGPERAGSTGGRRTGIKQTTLWGSPCSPGRGVRRRLPNFGAAPVSAPPRDLIGVRRAGADRLPLPAALPGVPA